MQDETTPGRRAPFDIMKLVIVSDLHLVTPGATLFGLDPLERLEACIGDINANHADADLVVFAGDLTDDGRADAYAALADRLGLLLPPHRLMLGNHDDRAAFRQVFADAPEVDGFLQSRADIGGLRLIFLDTLWPGHVEGQLCNRRLAWLDEQLASVADALVFLHHPPMPIGIASLDACRLSDPDALLALLKARGNVRHLFAGHVHRLSHGNWDGIPFTTVRGTSHQSALRFDGPHAISFEASAYSIVLAGRKGVVVHTQEFEAKRPGASMPASADTA